MDEKIRKYLQWLDSKCAEAEELRNCAWTSLTTMGVGTLTAGQKANSYTSST